MCMIFSQCNTCSMVIYQAYDTISRDRVWPHASRAMPTPFNLSIMKLVSFGPSTFMYINTLRFLVVRLSVRDGCGRGRKEFAVRVQNHLVRLLRV